MHVPRRRYLEHVGSLLTIDESLLHWLHPMVNAGIEKPNNSRKKETKTYKRKTKNNTGLGIRGRLPRGVRAPRRRAPGSKGARPAAAR